VSSFLDRSTLLLTGAFGGACFADLTSVEVAGILSAGALLTSMFVHYFAKRWNAEVSHG